MDVMIDRKLRLEETLNGLQMSGQPLIGMKNDKFQSSSLTDDLGSYYFIPKIADTLNITLEASINFFYGGLILIAFLISIFWILKSFKVTFYALYPIFLLSIVTLLTYKISDTYVASYFCVFVLLPLFFLKNKNNKNYLKIITSIRKSIF